MTVPYKLITTIPKKLITTIPNYWKVTANRNYSWIYPAINFTSTNYYSWIYPTEKEIKTNTPALAALAKYKLLNKLYFVFY